MTTQTQGDGILVVGNDGLRGTVRGPAASSPAGGSVEVSLADGRRVIVPVRLLQLRPDGTYHMPVGLNDLRAAQPTAAATGLAAGVAVGDAPGVMPLVAEQLEVHTRRVETSKVRVTKTVETEEQVIDLPTVREEVVVERVPIERFVAEMPPVRREGDTVVVSVIEEVLVVEKRLMLREEVRLTTRRVETHEPHTVTLRKEVAHVERVAADHPENLS